MRELDSDYEEDIREREEFQMPKKLKTIRFADDSEKPRKELEDDNKPNTVQQKMLSLSGQNIDEFMKEMENVQKKKEEERALEIKRVDPTPDIDMEELRGEKVIEKEVPEYPKAPEIPKDKLLAPPSMPAINLPPLPPAGIPMMFRPPPLRPMGIRMPPGPPPGRPMNRMGIRMPPGPPLGPPPRHMHHPKHHHHDRNMGNAPQMSKDPKSATITAKPQIRNLSADVTRFVPTTLRVKRDEVKKTKPRSFAQEVRQTQQVVKGPTKDDAYMQFMNEMNELL